MNSRLVNSTVINNHVLTHGVQVVDMVMMLVIFGFVVILVIV